jgi:hypothetical protein
MTLLVLVCIKLQLAIVKTKILVIVTGALLAPAPWALKICNDNIM